LHIAVGQIAGAQVGIAEVTTGEIAAGEIRAAQILAGKVEAGEVFSMYCLILLNMLQHHLYVHISSDIPHAGMHNVKRLRTRRVGASNKHSESPFW